MNQVHFLIALSCLSITAVYGQTVSDNFDDNSPDPALWEDPYASPDNVGNGQLSETNGMVEFTTDGSGETDVSQQLKQYPSYNQAWQVQMVASMSKDNFSATNELGGVSIDIGTSAPGDKWIGIGYGAGVLTNGVPAGEAVVSGGGDGVNPEHENITSLTLPPVLGVRVAYDPYLRTIRVYYDLDPDQNDGEWTLFESYTIDGSTNGSAVVLDWGMTPSDTFAIMIDGYSSGPAISAGSAWADDFEFIPGRTILTPTFADDFNDNSRDTDSWDEPNVYDGASGQMIEQNERLEFTANAEEENGVNQQLNHYPRYDETWQLQMLVSVDTNLFSSARDTGSMGFGIGNSTPSDHYIGFGYGAGVLTNGVPPMTVLFEEAVDDLNPSSDDGLHFATLPPVIAVRVTYDPNLHVVRLYYDLDANQPDREWTLLKAYTLDGSTNLLGAESRDWGMTNTDVFYVGIDAHSEMVAVPSGKIWVDDFEFNRGSTVQSDPGLQIVDDFNDDSPDAIWEAPVVYSGTPTIIEMSHRLEFVSSSTSGEQELEQRVIPSFWPRYDQAFEVKVEAHCLPGAMTVQDQVGGLDLFVANDFGAGDLFLSVAAIFDAGAVQQVLAADNSEVDPLADWPESIEFGALPEVVGLRVVWAPDTQILSCYFDTDTNRTVETWVLFADYTLDGSTNGTMHAADWQMAPTDHFRIGLNGFAENTVIQAGEAWFDNFSLVNQPLPVGYDLWALGIPDAGMRGTTVDASGNGIPNLLQYMYGLAPLSTDTEVQLTIRLENGLPVLIHGLNEDAGDYAFVYQAKTMLSDPWEWVSEGDATSVETFQSDGKTFLKITLPLYPMDTFIRLGVMPQP